MVRITASVATAILAFTPSILASPASTKGDEKIKFKTFLDQFQEGQFQLFQAADPEFLSFPSEKLADYANVTEVNGAPPNPEKYEREKRHIQGEDDRKHWKGGESHFKPDWPGTSVGMIESSGGVCSGALVGPRLVLTARHCVHGQSGIRFSPAYDRNARLGSSTISHIFAQDPKNDDPAPLCDRKDDYAILVLNQAYGDQLGYFGFMDPDPAKFDKPIYITQGYAGDIENAQIPVRQTGNQILSKRSLKCSGLGYLSTDTDAMGGQSGSPIWDEDENGGPHIVGVLSGGASTSDGKGGVETWTLAASGSGMTGWIKYMRESFP